MDNFVFYGRIHPENTPVTVPSIVNNLTALSTGEKIEIELSVNRGALLCKVRANYDGDSILTLRNAVEGCARAVMDIIGYLYAHAFDVEICSVVKGNGCKIEFDTSIPCLKEKACAGSVNIDAVTFASIMQDESLSNIILSDFKQAIRWPMQTGFFCYRSIESMMQTMKDEAASKLRDQGCNNPNHEKLDKAAWTLLREKLNVDRDAIDYIKKYADFPRHGKSVEVSDDDRKNIFSITHEVIGRYIKYVVAGRVASDFPRLKL